MQQVLAFESDLLEYEDIFDGSHVVEARTAELRDVAAAELDEVWSSAACSRRSTSSRLGSYAPWRLASGGSRAVSRSWSASTASPRRPLAARRRRGHRQGGPRGGGRDGRRRRALAIDTGRSRRHLRHWTSSAGWRRPPGAGPTSCRPPSPSLGRGDDRRVGRRLARGVREYRARRGGCGQRRAVKRPGRRRGAGGRADRRTASAARRQARARRSLERRRADRRRRPRRRHGRRVLNPAHARADRAPARDEDPDVIGLSVLSGSHRELVPQVLAQLASEAWTRR